MAKYCLMRAPLKAENALIQRFSEKRGPELKTLTFRPGTEERKPKFCPCEGGRTGVQTVGTGIRAVLWGSETAPPLPYPAPSPHLRGAHRITILGELIV